MDEALRTEICTRIRSALLDQRASEISRFGSSRYTEVPPDVVSAMADAFADTMGSRLCGELVDTPESYIHAVAERYGIIVGKDNGMVEDLAHRVSSNDAPVMRVYSRKTIESLFATYSPRVCLTTAWLASTLHRDLIRAREGLLDPRKFARKTTSTSVWRRIAELLNSGTDPDSVKSLLFAELSDQ